MNFFSEKPHKKRCATGEEETLAHKRNTTLIHQ